MHVEYVEDEAVRIYLTINVTWLYIPFDQLLVSLVTLFLSLKKKGGPREAKWDGNSTVSIQVLISWLGIAGSAILFWIVDFKTVRFFEVPEGSSNRLSGSVNIILLSGTLLLWTQSPVQEDINIRFEVYKVETLNLGLVKIWGSIRDSRDKE